MKYLIILLIGLLSVSCMTTKRIEKNCDLFAKVCITETETETEITTETTTETTYQDTTAVVHIPEEKVKDKIPVKIEDEKKKPIPVKKKFVNSELSVLSVPFATSYAQVVNSRLIHNLEQTDTLLRIKFENALRYSKTLEKQNKVLKEKYVVTVKENSPLAKFTVKYFFGSLIIIVLLLSYLIFKFKSKIIGIFKLL